MSNITSKQFNTLRSENLKASLNEWIKAKAEYDEKEKALKSARENLIRDMKRNHLNKVTEIPSEIYNAVLVKENQGREIIDMDKLEKEKKEIYDLIQSQFMKRTANYIKVQGF